MPILNVDLYCILIYTENEKKYLKCSSYVIAYILLIHFVWFWFGWVFLPLGSL